MRKTVRIETTLAIVNMPVKLESACGQWVVHRRYGHKRGWTITHAASGRYITCVTTLEWAKRVLHALELTGVRLDGQHDVEGLRGSAAVLRLVGCTPGECSVRNVIGV